MKSLLSLSSRWSVAMLAAALGLLLALTATGACRREPTDTRPASSGTPIDPPLLAFLGRARAAHHRADLLEERGDVRGAVRELEKLTGGPLPPRGLEVPEVREVMADTRARLGDLRSQTDDMAGALRDVEAGLTLMPDASYFRGHLLEVQGLIEERRARSAEQRAQELLAEAGGRLAERKDVLERVERRVAAAERHEREAAPAELEAARDERAAARAARDSLREGGLTAEERGRYEQLRAEARAARERALAAFERSMEIQAKVIESSLPQEPR